MLKKIMTVFALLAVFNISVYAADTTTTAPAATTAPATTAQPAATTASTTTAVPKPKPAVDCPATSAINGLWETFYLDTGARSAYVCITTKNGNLVGKIVKNYPRRGENPTICDKCPGNKKNKPFVGLEIVWGFTDNGNGEWVDGHILDAENGDVYTAKAQLQGKELHLRGYVLTPLFGKTTVWKKVDKIQ
jgi:uncharacterized protein (DUF2147 family)